MATGTGAMDPSVKRRKIEAPDRQESGELLISSPRNEKSPPAALRLLGSTSEAEESRGHEEAQPGAAGGEGRDAVDCISSLPDDILGEIISLLPTKEGARTQALASRWRHLWLSAPLNVDHSCPPYYDTSLIPRILASHPGPARRLSVRGICTYTDVEPVDFDAWFRSPALDNLQELELCAVTWLTRPCLPASAFRFSATLRAMTISGFRLSDDGAVETLRFPRLTKLGVTDLKISTGRLSGIIAGCPNLEWLLLKHIDHGDDRSVRINSPSLKRFAFQLFLNYELIIEDAPSLERMFQLKTCQTHVLVISAPKLEAVGGITDYYPSKVTIGSAVIEQLHVSFTTTVCSVKFLAINNYKLSLDKVINLMRCFPCLEQLNILTSNCSAGKNLWRRKHREFIRCFEIRLKVLVLRNYRGVWSHFNFAKFFIMNAKRLESVRFEGGPCKEYTNFILVQYKRIQLQKWASRGARFHFKFCACHVLDITDVNELSKANPYDCIMSRQCLMHALV